jgi:ankyrin repeat protein
LDPNTSNTFSFYHGWNRKEAELATGATHGQTSGDLLWNKISHNELTPRHKMTSHAPKAALPAQGTQGPVSNEDVELTAVHNGSAEPNLLLEEDIMQCARIGALGHIQTILQSGKYSATYADKEGITPLHWAAINNQYAVCKFLVDQGADVNAKGGESNATAAMWAAQRCHFYIVHLLLQSGTDPLLLDASGYNLLHLATIDGNTLLLILLLHQDIPVDVADPQGHTSLMWAGYKGWPACVDLLLRYGANVNATDENGYTPLHWALVKGSKPCLEKIIEFGADRFAKTNEGKTPSTCAEEMNSIQPWRRALAEQGYDANGNSKLLPLGLTSLVKHRSKMDKFFFLSPFLMIFIVLYILSHLSIFVGAPSAFAASFAMQYGIQQIANQGPADYKTLHKTPFLAGVFAATLFWVGIDWLTAVLPTTFRTRPFLNVFFALALGSTAYFHTTAMLEDPGHIPKLSSRNQQRKVIEELFSLWKFDEENFCVQCMVRKPLRSKHCRRCKRCVAKHDHHCPWINNCVGNNNIRHFFIYIISLEFGIAFFIALVWSYMELLPASATPQTCNILTPPLCSLVLRDPWTVTLTLWTTLQLTWVTLLLVVQSVQISKNQTTYENMKRHSHHHPPSHIPSGATSLNDTAAAASSLHTAPRKPDGCLRRWKKLLGLDTFMATAQDGLTDPNYRQDRGNPFSRGILGNCRDFWCDPAPIVGRRLNGDGYLGGEVVNYARLYETPLRMRSSGYTSVPDEGGEEGGEV